MTKEEILSLEAGEEIDNLVAEKVMGWHRGFYTSNLDGRTYTSDSESWLDADGHYMHGIGRYPEYDEENFHTIDWHPSESILWAWEVVEKINGNVGNDAGYQIYKDFHFCLPDNLEYETSDGAALSVCRAALLAMEGE